MATTPPAGIAQPMREQAPVLVLAAVLLGALPFVRALLGDPDTYWHLAAGEWILQHLTIPRTDPFSWTYAGRPWTAHEWLAEAAMALAYRAAGLRGLMILTAAAAATAYALLGVYLRQRLSMRVVLGFSMFVLLGLTPSLLARPHILALPFLVGWTLGLARASQERRAPSLWLLPVMAIWVNLHGSFVIGLALLAGFAIEALLAEGAQRWTIVRRWGLFSLLALGAALLNPQGAGALLFPLRVMRLDLLQVITEWQGADFSKPSLFEFVLMLGLFCSLWLGVRLPAVRAVMLLVALHLALAQARQQFVFVFVAAVLMRDPFAARLEPAPGMRGDAAPDPLESEWAAALAGLAALSALVGRLLLPLPIADGPATPVSAVASLPPQVRAGRVFNDYDFGGYLIFKGVRPFIDGRADMYGDAFVLRYRRMLAAPADAVRPQLDRWGVQWLLLEPGNPLNVAVRTAPEWRRVHADRYAVVYLRSGPGPSPTR